MDVCVILFGFYGLIISGELLKQLDVLSVISQPQKQGCHTLQRVDLARPFLVSPAIKIEIENSLGMALSKEKSDALTAACSGNNRRGRPTTGSKAAHCLSPTGATAAQLTQPATIVTSEMEQAALNRMAQSIAQLTLCQVIEEIATATKLLEKACQKLQGIPAVPPQRITDLDNATRQLHQLSCILELHDHSEL